MKYFKIIDNDIIIGVITSNDFMRYLSNTDCFIRADEQRGEYVSYNGKFYRSTWMRPIVQQADYTSVQIIPIEEEEYNIFVEALKSNEVIINEQEEEEYEEEEEEQAAYIDPIDRTTVEFIRGSKISEMSHACRGIIEGGFNIELSDNQIHHFSLDTQDQLNLITLSALAETQELIPYHADNEICKFYTAAEIKSIVTAATQFKMYHTTYYNALKNYINHLDNITDIAAVSYGMELPEEYQSDVLKAIT